MKPILSIQYLRGLAVLLVVMLHNTMGLRAYAPEIDIFHAGAFGVDIFFVISGFIIWTILNIRPMTPAKFIERRIIRIVPLYWALTLVTAFAVTDGALGINFGVDPGPLLRSLLFIPEWRADYPVAAPVMFVGWTLNLQVMVYAVFAGVLFLTPAKRLPALLAVLFALALAPLLTGELSHPILSLYTHPMVAEFGLGALLGWAYLKGMFKFGEQRGAWLNGLTLAFGAVAILFLRDRLPDIRVLYYGVPALMLVAGGLLCEGAIRKHPPALLKFLGDASYSIYLSHIIALAIAMKLIGAPLGADYPALALIGQTAFAAAFGGAVYFLIEIPLTNAARKAISPGRKAPGFSFSLPQWRTNAVSPEKL